MYVCGLWVVVGGWVCLFYKDVYLLNFMFNIHMYIYIYIYSALLEYDVEDFSRISFMFEVSVVFIVREIITLVEFYNYIHFKIQPKASN